MTFSPSVHIDAFGDAACPWDFSAEPARLRLLWRYGAHLEFRHRMVGLSSSPDEYAARGITTAHLAAGREMLGARFGMPIVTTEPERHLVTVTACRAVVGVRLRDPEGAARLLRRLRVLGMSEGLLIDEPETIARAAEEAGLAPKDVAMWADSLATAEALAADMAEARSPAPPALAMTERLARTADGGWRYTCPSYIITAGGRRLDSPGFQPARVYEVLVANVAPEIVPRPEPRGVAEVLEWAPYPLATAEIAGIMEVPVDTARRLLAEAGALAHPAAGDAYWSAG